MQKIRFPKITIKKEAGLTANLQHHRSGFFPIWKIDMVTCYLLSSLIIFHKKISQENKLSCFFFFLRKKKSQHPLHMDTHIKRFKDDRLGFAHDTMPESKSVHPVAYLVPIHPLYFNINKLY